MATTAYRNEFHRDWFKLSKGGNLVEAANEGTRTQAVLDGEQDVFAVLQAQQPAIRVRGCSDQSIIGGHTFALGARTEDEVDRFQPTERYDQINGQLVASGVVEPNASNNRIQTAEALSFWATDAWQISDALRLDLALRHECERRETRFDDVGRQNIASTRDNDLLIWLPGRRPYEVNDTWSLLAGVHRGFSPLGGSARAWEKPETSINYEFGARYDGRVFVEVIGFYSDFSNKGELLNAYPCSNGATSGTLITGEAVVAGSRCR